ncbi:MAG: ComF family protein [Clostridia bacterium]
MNSAWAKLRWFKRYFLILCFPQSNICHLCKRSLPNLGRLTLCEDCAQKLAAYRIPHKEAVMGLHEPLEACIAAYWHDGQARELTHKLKYGADRMAARVLAEGMADAWAEAVGGLEFGTALVVPVPLHMRREQERGFNQALLLAQAFCEHTGQRLVTDALIRVHYTKTQTKQTRAERLESMRNAFAVAGEEVVFNKPVLLIDDVLTTGGTAVACAEALLSAGASKVVLLTACRA